MARRASCPNADALVVVAGLSTVSPVQAFRIVRAPRATESALLRDKFANRKKTLDTGRPTKRVGMLEINQEIVNGTRLHRIAAPWGTVGWNPGPGCKQEQVMAWVP